ncbi:MAG: Asp-tRNA(Asn)/Glu-tRNA(Gln) amidotransferase subunit GatC [Fimbriimonadaceae bacterium]|nr:Asp-tRNA(Asn)/Glu-tRNA(Gln) amidotransferase subunit GatC [Chthonomonadaceae bacterium]MCO5296144.1 Asp-tRNA(Asn)/Glu-tRNA(Gln) amidotransferase subunit GatC [Fimbriimonadaceae bacterium]
MSITLDEVRHVAKLARLELDEAEILALQGELNSLLGHFADIEELDARSEDGLTHSVTLANVWSEDRIGVCLTPEEALRGAPKSKAGLFVVPTIIED